MITWATPNVPSLPGNGPTVMLHDATTGVLQPAATGPVATLYVCGITPYDSTHLGHASTYLAFDLLRRAWLDQGLTVRAASNVTDVDDPLLERADATGVDWRELAADQSALFAQDMAALSVLPPDVYVAVSECVPRLAEVVEQMLAAGAAYRVPTPEVDGPGDVYADLGVDPAFGSVSGFDEPTMLALSAQRGGDPQRAGKRHPLDPLLWRRERPGEPAWEAGVLGRGRPGWHIECAVIALDGLGLPIDVQGGGSDLLFPHHEMSCSHARVLAPGTTPARVHTHAGMVALDGQKMSKSLGNLVFVGRLREQGADPSAIRLAVHAHHYRDDWEWTQVGLDEALLRLDRWREAAARPTGPSGELLLAEVRAALSDDLDSPRALAAIDAWAGTDGDDPQAPALVTMVAEALLGVRW
ncbi:cysteine--1-D-myo-inosityl 2-amino-2-deoxy-alpha-D-glucopyranoside ligase [Cellulomonas citrea]|uniref:cysteine--1-D-myo-inosityl 2-amino-2-deoxy-alpha-D-glucopyranoside ligase n=1 Tax=Cellulomonas citrea TaxID=1909423 RepID=UPI00135B5BFF|nr:cysteine--1-D-myo-inosityl 2-amino-2-deoxy-alpha-D-glucopyranoside ligase [Cellulomonas citrea]